MPDPATEALKASPTTEAQPPKPPDLSTPDGIVSMLRDGHPMVPEAPRNEKIAFYRQMKRETLAEIQRQQMTYRPHAKTPQPRQDLLWNLVLDARYCLDLATRIDDELGKLESE